MFWIWLPHSILIGIVMCVLIGAHIQISLVERKSTLLIKPVFFAHCHRFTPTFAIAVVVLLENQFCVAKNDRMFTDDVVFERNEIEWKKE